MCQLLDEPRALNGDTLQKPIDALQKPINKIHFTELAASFVDACAMDHKSTTQKNWRALQDLLSVPLIPAKTRLELVDLSARKSVAT